VGRENVKDYLKSWPALRKAPNTKKISNAS